MTTFLLIRHGSHDLLGKTLAGRISGVHLNEAGVREAEQLAERLAGAGIAAILASPRERAQETAAPLARRLGLTIRTCAELDEVDFGDWNGRTFADLQGDSQWQVWCNRRSEACPPNGETLQAVQTRVVATLERLRREHPDDTLALVSHADVVKTVIASVLGMSLDHLQRFEIAPASISVVAMGEGWAQVRLVNGTRGVVAE